MEALCPEHTCTVLSRILKEVPRAVPGARLGSLALVAAYKYCPGDLERKIWVRGALQASVNDTDARRCCRLTT